MSVASGKPFGLASAGALLVALILAGLWSQAPGAIDVGSPADEAAFTAFACGAALVYFAAAALVLRRPATSRGLWLVVGVALAMRIVVLAGPPFRSSDIFRYVWDGEVQVAGVNPYRYVPADPALTPLRDAAIFPHINRAEYAHTIYPPMAQLIFAAVARIDPSTLAMRLAMLGFDLVAMLVAIRLLAEAGIDRARVLIYAWNPLVVWELAGNGHVDAAAIGFVALALLARRHGRNTLTGLALGAAMLVKFLPLALFPALWRRWDWRMPAAMAVLAIALYAIYSGVGWGVFGFLPGYAQEEGLRNGGGILWLEALSRVITLPAYAGKLWLVAVAAGLGALALHIIRRPPDAGGETISLGRDVGTLACAVIVAITPHYPWYFAWLALPACLAPSASLIWLSAAAILQNHDPFGDYVVQMSGIYLPFFALVVIERYRSRAVHRPCNRVPEAAAITRSPS